MLPHSSLTFQEKFLLDDANNRTYERIILNNATTFFSPASILKLHFSKASDQIDD